MFGPNLFTFVGIFWSVFTMLYSGQKQNKTNMALKSKPQEGAVVQDICELKVGAKMYCVNLFFFKES